ncbi:MAG: PEP-CTERM sorting domain-containing protein [Phycisphaerae bacterium]
MLKKFLAVGAAALALSAFASASITHSLQAVAGAYPITSGAADSTAPNYTNGTYYVVDLMATVGAGDDWTQTSLSVGGATGARVTNGTFFDHSLNLGSPSGDNPPNPALFPVFPALQWDSYYVASDGTTPSYAGSATTTPTQRSAVWFSTPPNGGAGTFRIGRFTIIANGAWSLNVQGGSTTVQGGGTIFPFNLTIPEPSTLALLVLGSVAGLIRRR